MPTSYFCGMLADNPRKFEFSRLPQKGHPFGLPVNPALGLDLVHIAKEILVLENSPKSQDYAGGDRRFLTGNIMEEPAVSATADSPTSRFTAVNGEKQVAGPTPSTGKASSRRSSDARSNGQPRITPPGQEKLTITTTTTQRDDWAQPTIENRQPFQTPTQYSDAEASMKRKRSNSLGLSASSNPYHGHAVPSSTKETPTTATTESDGPRDEISRAQADHRETYSADSYRQFMASAEDSRDVNPDLWHARQYNPPSHINTDQQIGEVLQRASQSMDAQRHHEYDQGSPDDDRSANPYNYGQDQRETSAQSDPKKRKRNFSNRTKTGCMTCRKRKKKCDETHPECRLTTNIRQMNEQQ